MLRSGGFRQRTDDACLSRLYDRERRHHWDAVCTELRDEIARSPRYREISSGTEETHWGLHIVSTTTDESKLVSAESVTITEGAYLQYFVEDYVLVTAQNQVNHQAQTILAALDEQVTKLADAKSGRE